MSDTTIASGVSGLSSLGQILASIAMDKVDYPAPYSLTDIGSTGNPMWDQLVASMEAANQAKYQRELDAAKAKAAEQAQVTGALSTTGNLAGSYALIKPIASKLLESSGEGFLAEEGFVDAAGNPLTYGEPATTTATATTVPELVTVEAMPTAAEATAAETAAAAEAATGAEAAGATSLASVALPLAIAMAVMYAMAPEGLDVSGRIAKGGKEGGDWLLGNNSLANEAIEDTVGEAGKGLDKIMKSIFG